MLFESLPYQAHDIGQFFLIVESHFNITTTRVTNTGDISDQISRVVQFSVEIHDTMR